MHQGSSEGLYVISDPIKAFGAIGLARQTFLNEETSISPMERRSGVKYPRAPEFLISSFSGPEFNDETIEDMPESGVLLIHHIYLGEFRLATGYQWAGRPDGIPGSQQEGFVR
jgi:hypothetical protein